MTPDRRREAGLQWAAMMRDALRRSSAVLAQDPALRATTSTRDDFASLRAHGHAIDLLAAAFERYHARPCVAERARAAPGAPVEARFLPLTYGEVWHRVVALATALAARGLARAGDRVAILGFASIDWVIADLACLYLGATSVPLQTSLSPDDLAHVTAEAKPVCLLASADYLDAIAPIVRVPEVREVVVFDEAHVTPGALAAAIARTGRDVVRLSALLDLGRTVPSLAPARVGDDDLVTLSYTSGSTGRPKGVLYPDRRWLQRMHEALADAPLPYVSIGYLPLSQMGGRLTTLRSLVVGGLVCFSPATDLSSFLEDARLARPTQLMMIPRVSSLVYQAYQRRVLAEGAAREAAIVDDMRASFLGDRLCLVTTGAAPTAPEVLAFLARCFGISVINTYGATELGMVAVNGHVRPDVDYKLADVPELGYTTRDLPYPRGELLVRTPYKAPGYFDGSAAARGLEDADGFIRSGDIVEERAPRHVVWIDRRSDVVRLQQGEFVSVSRLEQIYVAGGPHFAQVFIHANPLRAYVLAVVVPHADTLADDDVRRELERIARAHGLKRHEVPREVIVERTPFSRDNGLLTESDKPRRTALKAAYGPRLDALADALEARQLRDLTPADVEGLPLAARLARAAQVALGRDDLDVEAASFVELGGDSLTAQRFVQLAERVCGRAPSIAAVLDASTTIAQLAARLTATPTGRPTLTGLHGDAPTHLRASQLTVARVLGEDALVSLPPPSAITAPRVVLVTGATGFLGKFVTLELLARMPPNGRVVCLARARDDAAARARLAAGYARDPALAARYAELCATGLDARAGDLLQPRFGLPGEVYDELAREIDEVVHCGALVNHVLPYAELFEPNVLGTAEVMRFALRSRLKPIRFASSIGVTAALRTTGEVSEEVAPATLRGHFPLGNAYGLGYSASKWAGEVMLADLVRAGVPVQLFRCGMLLAHRGYSHQINETDLFSRLLFGLARTGIAPPSFYAPGAARSFEGLPVDVVAAAIAAAPPTEGLTIYHATSDRRDDGASLDRVADWIGEAGLPLRRAADHATWFAEFRDRLSALDEAARRRSPLAAIERWAQPTDATEAPRLSTVRFRALVREALGVAELPGLDAALVRRSLDALALLPGGGR